MARRLPGTRRRWAVLVSAVIAVVLALIGLDGPLWIESYRVADVRTIAVTVADAGQWTRVTSVEETATTVTVSIRMFRIQLGPGSDDGILRELTVGLRDPLGTRTLIDANTGIPVRLGP